MLTASHHFITVCFLFCFLNTILNADCIRLFFFIFFYTILNADCIPLCCCCLYMILNADSITLIFLFYMILNAEPPL